MERVSSSSLQEAFHSLPMGDKFLLVGNSNLEPHLNRLKDEYKSVVEYEYLKEGPDEWEAVVSKKYYNFI